jgi:glucose-1-phosphate adenylyltransferase
VTDSIIGVRAVVREGAVIERTVVMGANSWENQPPDGSTQVPIGIGRDCHIRNAILDFNVRIGDGCRLVNEAGIQHADGENYAIRDGIIVVMKNAVLPPGTVI